jgi:hypothetical protein
MRITITPRMVERPGAPPQPPLSNNAVARQTPPPAEPTATRPAPRPPQKLAVAETRPETREVTESPPIQTTTTFPVTTTTAPPVTPTTRENAQSAPDEVPATTQTEEHKSSFMHKLNPLNWFSGKSRKSDESPKPTPVDIANIERYSYPLSVTPIPGDRQRAQQLTAEGRQAERQSNRSQAMQYYREAMKADPTYFDPTVALGLAALDAKDYNTALDALGQALTIQGNSVDARYAFAWVLGKKGYYQDAANELDRLLAGHPREVRAHLLLGNLYADNLGQPKLAREQYLKALELVDPQSSQAAVIRSWLEENP